MDLTVEIYRIVKKLPKDEIFGLSIQMRKAAVSIPSNIAEGNGRQTPGEFQQFLRIARGSAAELETQLLICVKVKYFTHEEIKQAMELLTEISKMLFNLMKNN